jgi:hypothetical protein
VGQFWIVLGAIVLVAAVAMVLVRRRDELARQRRANAIAAFDVQRPTLEAEFLAAAAATGKPRGLRWTAARLDGPSSFAVDRVSNELFALITATVSFEAVEGGGMEEVEAVSNLRAATAVFVHRDGRWTSDGRAVFNLDPAGTLNHYRESLATLTTDGTP